MYVTFRNYSTGSKMLVTLGNQRFTVNPESSVEVLHSGGKIEFEAQGDFFEELLEGIDEIDEKDKNDSLKDRILTKLTKGFVKKVTEFLLLLSVKYEVDLIGCENPVINLFDGDYSFFEGRVAEVFDMPPVIMAFPRAETESGEIRITDITELNRKKYLRLWRNILLFANWGLFLADLLFFIPEYLTVRIFSSHFFLRKIFVSLYKKPPMERARIFAEKELKYERETEEKGCLTYILRGLLALAVIIGIFLWAGTGE